MVPDEATMFDVEARHLFYNADTNRVSGRGEWHLTPIWGVAGAGHFFYNNRGVMEWYMCLHFKGYI